MFLQNFLEECRTAVPTVEITEKKNGYKYQKWRSDIKLWRHVRWPNLDDVAKQFGERSQAGSAALNGLNTTNGTSKGAQRESFVIPFSSAFFLLYGLKFHLHFACYLPYENKNSRAALTCNGYIARAR